MSKFLGLILAGAIVAGAAVAAYNHVVYDRLQPFPLAWNHDAEEFALIQLERERAALLAKLGSAQRIASIGGALLPLETTAGHQERLQRERAALDERIARLRATITARTGRAP
jgi:hypothetical protein